MLTIAGQEWTYTVGSISSLSAAADFLLRESAIEAAWNINTSLFLIRFQNKVVRYLRDDSQ